jgi:putative transposase
VYIAIALLRFGHISEKAIRRGSFREKELVSKIEEFVAHYNKHARPFEWKATADSILKKVKKYANLF